MIENANLKNDCLLRVNDLSIQFNLKRHQVLRAVDGVSLNIEAGEILGLVGESGSGKTVLSLSLLRLATSPGRVTNGQILWQGQDITKLGVQAMRQLRGSGMAMIFQNPQASLNPVYTVGAQMTSVMRLHRRLSKKDAQDEVIRLLRLVRIPDAEKRIKDYPYQFSIGMCQRIMIAMALACQPKL